MKKMIVALVVLSVGFCLRAADADKVTVGEGEDARTYELKTVEGAKAYIDAYADNVQTDREFKAHEQTALETIRTENRFFGAWWAILPPLIAIFLALITKEVYSSLFIGIVTGGLLYSGFTFEGTLTHVMQKGFVSSIADAYNVGILLFLVLLGSLVAMMNKTGASAAFGRWAEAHIKSRVGAQVATIVLGILIFVDDYFNCLTVGSVMRPVTDAKKVSRAKLAYLIDATAAPICIIAPISSWAPTRVLMCDSAQRPNAADAPVLFIIATSAPSRTRKMMMPMLYESAIFETNPSCITWVIVVWKISEKPVSFQA